MRPATATTAGAAATGMCGAVSPLLLVLRFRVLRGLGLPSTSQRGDLQQARGYGVARRYRLVDPRVGRVQVVLTALDPPQGFLNGEVGLAYGGDPGQELGEGQHERIPIRVQLELDCRVLGSSVAVAQVGRLRFGHA